MLYFARVEVQLLMAAQLFFHNHIPDHYVPVGIRRACTSRAWVAFPRLSRYWSPVIRSGMERQSGSGTEQQIERDGAAEWERDEAVNSERNGAVVPGAEPVKRCKEGSHRDRRSSITHLSNHQLRVAGNVYAGLYC